MKEMTSEYIGHVLLDMGEALLKCGAEVHRVEDTMTRIATCCGACSINIFVITSNIILTLGFPDGSEITQTRRIYGGGTNFIKLEALNKGSRAFCEREMKLEELAEQIQIIMKKQENTASLYVGSVIAVISFCLFFGGSVIDSIVAGMIALLVCWMQLNFAPHCMNTVTFNFFTALVTGILICVVAKGTTPLHIDSIIIGDIMLLIPGIALTNSVRDMMLGDTISGIMRLIEALIWTSSLAGGFVMAIWLTGGVVA